MFEVNTKRYKVLIKDNQGKNILLLSSLLLISTMFRNANSPKFDLQVRSKSFGLTLLQIHCISCSPQYVCELFDTNDCPNVYGCNPRVPIGISIRELEAFSIFILGRGIIRLKLTITNETNVILAFFKDKDTIFLQNQI